MGELLEAFREVFTGKSKKLVDTKEEKAERKIERIINLKTKELINELVLLSKKEKEREFNILVRKAKWFIFWRRASWSTLIFFVILKVLGIRGVDVFSLLYLSIFFVLLFLCETMRFISKNMLRKSLREIIYKNI